MFYGLINIFINTLNVEFLILIFGSLNKFKRRKKQELLFKFYQCGIQIKGLINAKNKQKSPEGENGKTPKKTLSLKILP